MFFFFSKGMFYVFRCGIFAEYIFVGFSWVYVLDSVFFLYKEHYNYNFYYENRFSRPVAIIQKTHMLVVFDGATVMKQVKLIN